MTFTYVGLVPRQLESGRPLVFGDVVDSLDPADQEAFGELMVSTEQAPPEPAPPEPEPAPTDPATTTSEVT